MSNSHNGIAARFQFNVNTSKTGIINVLVCPRNLLPLSIKNYKMKRLTKITNRRSCFCSKRNNIKLHNV